MEKDIEGFTHNQLEVSKIKHLKRVASALESIAQSLSKGVEVRIIPAQITSGSSDLVDNFQMQEIDRTPNPFWKNKIAPEVPDENPYSETDLGLSDEEKAVIEEEIKPAAPRAMPRTPVKGKK